jgi:hypothetical protein
MDLHAVGSDLGALADVVPAFIGPVVAGSGERLPVADGSWFGFSVTICRASKRFAASGSCEGR